MAFSGRKRRKRSKAKNKGRTCAFVEKQDEFQTSSWKETCTGGK